MLHHVSLEVRHDQVEDCARFWTLLGFERVEPPPTLVHRAAWMQGGPTQIHLLYADEPTIPPEGHTAVVVDDYDRVLEELERAGFPPERRREHWGAARSVVQDPAGHRVEVMASAPAGR
jgi:catechol 2,3-dioxygenase-like lactoylglutathione lyase family enzyme